MTPSPFKALKQLVAKLDHVHADERYMAVWQIAQTHAGPYTGPKYERELEAARAALAAVRGKE